MVFSRSAFSIGHRVMTSREWHGWPINRAVSRYSAHTVNLWGRGAEKVFDGLVLPAIIRAIENGGHHSVCPWFADRYLFFNCLEILDAVVSPQAFSDRR
jgi:hypothetical protein